MIFKNTVTTVLLLLAGIASIASAGTIRVPQDQPTVRFALSVAADGDTVLVTGGTVARTVYYQSNVITLIADAVLGNRFRTFVERLENATPTVRSAIVDSFMNTTQAFPFIDEDVFAYFIYRGSAASINIAGDANGWSSSAFPMTRLFGTDLWYGEQVYEPSARLDYKLVINGSNWILDPLNPNQVSGGFGPNSELAMLEYEQPWELATDPSVAKGALGDTLLASTTLNNTRLIRIYTPPGYDNMPADSFPMILFHDGQEYLSLAFARNVFDNLIAAQRIRPVIAVFVPPVDRNEEYGFAKRFQYEQFIVDEVMPMLEGKYRIFRDPSQRAMSGPSLGGLITTQICYNHPDVFGLAAPVSPSYWANSRAVFNNVVNGPVKPVTFFLDWGTYESSIMVDGRLMRDALQNMGYASDWREWYEGHSWGSWRAHMDDFLEYFFPGAAVGIPVEEILPVNARLYPNFPNPFNPTTTIRFVLDAPARAILTVYNLTGQRVATLVNAGLPAGDHRADWQGKDATGNPVSSGVYFYQLRLQESRGERVETRRMILLK